jgi:carboxyl-terminal processing protease
LSSGQSTPGTGSAPPYFFGGIAVGALVLFAVLVLVAPVREAILPGQDGGVTGQARGIIEDSYFKPSTDAELDNGSISGMVSEIRQRSGDKFSHYFDPEAYRRFNQVTSGEFYGIGLAVSEVKEGLRVSQVYEDTPAERAGIDEGDLITAVEGKSIAGVSATESSARIKGPPGTKVEITVEDAKTGKSRDIEVERAAVRIPAVTGRLIKRDGAKIAYVQLATFSNGVHGEVRSEIERLQKKGAEGIVFDLRGNGGGLLNEAVLVGSIWVDDGPIVSTEGRSRPKQVYDAVGDALDPVPPTVVLTNRDTASASEIVSAALKENDLAETVGTRTYGKGTFQEVIDLENGGALDLTVGEYLTADGSSILDVGVKPDVHVADDDPSDGDAQLDEGVSIVAEEIAGAQADSGSAAG